MLPWEANRRGIFFIQVTGGRSRLRKGGRSCWAGPSAGAVRRAGLLIPRCLLAPPLAAGLAWTAIDQNPKLKSFFDVLTLSADRGGAVYVSTMEARDYPITAVQW